MSRPIWLALSERTNTIATMIRHGRIATATMRIQVVGGGCSGFSYRMGFDKNYNDQNDAIFEFDGLKVFVDKASLLYMEGAEVDYIEGLHGAGFKFSNPNSTGSCGCGSSFSV